MKPRRTLYLAAGLLALGLVLAFFLQDVVRQAVVTPLAYAWWVLRLYYTSVPQVVLWILLLAGLLLVLLTSLFAWIPAGRKYEKLYKPSIGAVESLSAWIAKSGDSTYYKWMVANRLGKLKRTLDESPQASARAGGNTPEAVRRYLQAGLDESFVDYPRPRLPFLRSGPTPFDLDVEQAVEALEKEMEDK